MSEETLKPCDHELTFFHIETKAGCFCKKCEADSLTVVEDFKSRIKELEEQIVELVGLEKPTSIRSAAKIIVDFESEPSAVTLRAVRMIYDEFCFIFQKIQKHEAWQKDAVPLLKNRLSFCDKYEKIEIRKLIEQAEKHGE